MQPFTRIQSTAALLLRDNIDTDTIIRVERLFNAVPRADLGLYCLESLRHLPDSSPDPEFFRNDPRYQGASILLCGRNFGCGSAREGAVWALASMGIRCIIAPSVADLFAANCFQNGLLVFTLDQAHVEYLAAGISADPAGRHVIVDLERCLTGFADGEPIPFSIPARRREALLEGLDEIDLTLKQQAKIQSFRRRDDELRPWIYRF